MSGPSCRVANVNPLVQPPYGGMPQRGYTGPLNGMTVYETDASLRVPQKRTYLATSYYNGGCITPHCAATEGCPNQTAAIQVGPATQAMFAATFDARADPFVTNSIPPAIFLGRSGYDSVLGWTQTPSGGLLWKQ